MRTVVVVGGGVTGLVAAYRLRRLLGPSVRITLVEQSDRLGGKLRTVDLAGVPTDVGAEAFVLRNPAAVDLVTELGLDGELIHPGTASATVRAGGRTVALPKRTFLGVPAEPDAVRGVLSEEAAERVAAEESLPPLRVPAGGDVSVGEVLGERFGRELVDHLVEPLLGGVYAGRADLLGLRATMPALVDALDEAGGSLTRAAGRVLGGAGGGVGGQPGAGDPAGGSGRPGGLGAGGSGGSAGSAGGSGVSEGAGGLGAGAGSAGPEGGGGSGGVAGSGGGSGRVGVGGGGRGAASVASGGAAAGGRRPVFGALREGMGTLVDHLTWRTSMDVRLGSPVRELVRDGQGWRLELGSPGRARVLHADAVVLAVPPPSARRLLSGLAPGAAAGYAGIEVGSMAVVSLAFPDGTELPASSGLLLAVGERRPDGAAFTAKAFTHTSVKWDWGPPRLRASVGRVGETQLLQRDDEELMAAVLGDLRELTGLAAHPIDWLVTRWGGGLPQYGVGHVEAVAAIEAAVAGLPGLEVAGASFRGVGIPACVDSATGAAERVAAHLRAQPDGG